MKKLCAGLVLAISFASATAFADDTADLWKAKCKSCHGADGKADTKEGRKSKIDDMSTAEWQSKHSDAEIKKVISEGKPDTKMKPYKDKLSEAEIDGLVKYIRGLKQ
ncbi:MAG: cytochrome c [Myxococcaceae bacterium]|nr:cytochrome c [Myxococcaceae bacterium]